MLDEWQCLVLGESGALLLDKSRGVLYEGCSVGVYGKGIARVGKQIYKF